MMIKNYNHYNLNPPEPAIIFQIKTPTEEFEDIVAEHNLEQDYEEYEIRNHIDIDDYRNTELIKNECKIKV